MRVAIVHYWLTGMRGGEKVLEILCKMYPQADIYTLFYDRESVSDVIGKHKIFASRANGSKILRRHYQRLLPLMPFWLESFDLSEYDLVISSESGPAKAVIVPPTATHVCYCHSPMRYIWDQHAQYRRESSRLTSVMLTILGPFLRVWDVTSSLRVDQFIANSSFVASRILKYYRRKSVVVHPPVDLQRFSIGARGDYYLCAGQLVGYKRVDLAVEACSRLGRKLVILGDGPELRKLRLKSNDQVTFMGRVSDEEWSRQMRNCRALIFPGEEDFGIVPLEAAASGKAVIAYGRGGALETVVDGVTGLFFGEQTVDALEASLIRYETDLEPNLDPTAIARHASNFSEERFIREFDRACSAAVQGVQTGC